MGVRIFASSYTLIPFYYRTAYQGTEEKLAEIWGGVPEDIDLLVTHGPPYMVQDKTVENTHAGSQTIR